MEEGDENRKNRMNANGKSERKLKIFCFRDVREPWNKKREVHNHFFQNAKRDAAEKNCRLRFLGGYLTGIVDQEREDVYIVLLGEQWKSIVVSALCSDQVGISRG